MVGVVAALLVSGMSAQAPPVVAQVLDTPAAVEATQPTLRNTKLRGYVTEIRSPTDFDIEDYRISREESLALDFKNASPEIKFALSDIRVGVELEIRGQLNEATGSLKAQSILVDLEQFTSITQTAFVTTQPAGIQLLDGTWTGELHADGQTIRVGGNTKVLFTPTKREQKLAKLRAKTSNSETEFGALKSLDQVSVGMAMTYTGRRNRETGTIIAERVEFSTNDLEDGEAKMWKSLKASITPAKGLTPGTLKIDKIGTFKLLPDQEVQDYVASLGQRLIPEYQRELTINDPRRIPFQFFVVLDHAVNAFATPNGIVVVNSGMMEMLENEAQLAAIVGHEIAHSTYEHSWRARQFHKKKRIGIAIVGAFLSGYGLSNLADIATMVNGAIINGHQRTLENQSDRVGLQYMVAAGYDPRQAPAVWKLMAHTVGVSSTNFFWSSHDNAPTRRSYLMNELKNNYREVNYSQLRLHAETYSRIKAAVVSANGQKKQLTVH